jgi:hypothetical protein
VVQQMFEVVKIKTGFYPMEYRRIFAINGIREILQHTNKLNLQIKMVFVFCLFFNRESSEIILSVNVYHGETVCT